MDNSFKDYKLSNEIGESLRFDGLPKAYRGAEKSYKAGS